MSRTRSTQGRSHKVRQAPLKTSTPRVEVLADLDTQLMLRVRAGNREAANTLVRRNFARVSRYISRLVRKTGPVEDLVQDVFVRVWHSSDRYEPTAKFSTWLYRIATNTALNYLGRSSAKEIQEPDPEVANHDIADPSDSAPERDLTLEEMRERISSAIASLPVKQRIALTLFEYEELSYEQIAGVLDTSVESVRSLLKRARHLLRDKLSGVL
ncbi:MAG: sigma-70 family RNA polymerase sigma factor [Planctomycetota bacterium]